MYHGVSEGHALANVQEHGISFFNTAYYMYIVCLKLLFFIFSQLCSLQRKNGLSLRNTYMYLNNHACKEFSKHISHTFKVDLVDFYLLWLMEQQMSHVYS